MKSLNLQKTLNKWCNSLAAVNILAEHLRSRIMAIHKGAGGWARMQQAEQLKLIKRRSFTIAMTLLGVGDREKV